MDGMGGCMEGWLHTWTVKRPCYMPGPHNDLLSLPIPKLILHLKAQISLGVLGTNSSLSGLVTYLGIARNLQGNPSGLYPSSLPFRPPV